MCEDYCARKKQGLGCVKIIVPEKTRTWVCEDYCARKKQGLGCVKIIVPRKTQTSGCKDYCARKNPKDFLGAKITVPGKGKAKTTVRETKRKNRKSNLV